VFSINKKTDHHNITGILLKLVLNIGSLFATNGISYVSTQDFLILKLEL
jgi:hypothetical protein